jgi:hypothetical protein
MDQIVRNMIREAFKKVNPNALSYEQAYHKFNLLKELYDNIRRKPITFVAKKFMLSTVLEEMLLIQSRRDVLGLEPAARSLSLLKGYLNDYFQFGSDVFTYQSKYPDLLEKEKDFNSYIGDESADGLYLTTNRAIKDEKMQTDLLILVKKLVEARGVKGYNINQIFETLKKDADHINTLGIESGAIFQGMLDAITVFLKDRSFNTVPFFGSSLTLEDQKQLKSHGVSIVGFNAFNPVAEYASTTQKVVHTIRYIENLRDQAKAKTTKPT